MRYYKVYYSIFYKCTKQFNDYLSIYANNKKDAKTQATKTLIQHSKNYDDILKITSIQRG